MNTSSAPSSHRIHSVSITAGFLRNLRLSFVPGLNVIMGGCGTGKSTALSYLRYALATPVGPTRAAALASLTEDTLGRGTIEASIETKYGVHYRVTRKHDEAPAVFDTNNNPCSITLDRDGVFGADIYGQKELFEIAMTPRLQLMLLERFAIDDVRRIVSEATRVEHDLAHTARELLRLVEEERDLAEQTSEIGSLEAKLAALKPVGGPNADAVTKAHAERGFRERQKRAMDDVAGDLNALREDARTIAASLGDKLTARFEGDVLAGPNTAAVTALANRARKAHDAIKTALASIVTACEDASSALAPDTRVLQKAHADQEEEYRAIIARSQETATMTTERELVQTRLAALASAKKQLAARREERAASQKKWRDLFARLSELRDERSALHVRVADDLSRRLGPTIRVRIEQAKGRAKFVEVVTEALKGTPMKHAAVAAKICAALAPDELFAIVQRGDKERLAELAGLDVARADKVVGHLRDSESIYAIEVVELEDVPSIELLHGEYKPPSKLSPGQKCTAILPIVLLESDRLLVLDQPEDDIDKEFLDQILRTLREVQATRQIVIVTHDANFPVCGDAQRVFMLASDGSTGRIAKEGTVVEMRAEIEALLDGGREAFAKRMELYGY